MTASCVGVAVVRPAAITTPLDRQFLNTVARYGPVPTEVRGNPFNIPQDRLEVVVTDAISGATFGPKLDFTTSPSPDTRSPYRLYVLLNPARNARPETTCAGGEQPLGAQARGTSVLMVFCSSEAKVSSTVGSRYDVAGPGPAFDQLLRATVVELLPSKEFDKNSRDGFTRS